MAPRRRSSSSSTPPASSSSLVLITAVLYLTTTACIITPVAAFNYAEALDKALLFFEAQRSGKLPPPPGRVTTWRGDSGVSDGAAAGVDLSGGYYDAGDNVKFGFPMAFTVTMLSWSVLEFMPFSSSSSSGAGDAGGRAAVRWGADYLLKAAAAAPRALYVQVADPYQDHRCWERPEDMDTPRQVYMVTPDKPGSDVAGETAAALAAASLVFRTCDPAYSARLLQTAQKVFDFADRDRGSYSDSLSSVVCPFYCSYSGYHDELLWAAAWLHMATAAAGPAHDVGNSSDVYLSYIKSNGQNLGAEQDDFTFSWDDKRAGTKVLLAKAFLAATTTTKPPATASAALRVYKAHADAYVCSLVPAGGGAPPPSQQFTPGGLLFKSGDSNMQYVTSAAFLLLAYANSLSSSSAAGGGGASAVQVTCCGGVGVPAAALVAVAKRQVDYILGANPAATSYMVGFGARFPRRVHHRAASMPSVRDHPARIGCDEGFRYLHSPDPDANVLVGAVVGGPNDGGDGFTDSRDNYAQTEPSTYTNAPLVGALAFFAGGRHR